MVCVGPVVYEVFFVKMSSPQRAQLILAQTYPTLCGKEAS